MQCERCGQREATVHVTRVHDDQALATSEHVCGVCAGAPPTGLLAEFIREVERLGGRPLTPAERLILETGVPEDLREPPKAPDAEGS